MTRRFPAFAAPSLVTLSAGGAFLGLLLGGAIHAQVVTPEWALPPTYGEERPDHVYIGVWKPDVSGDEGRFQARSDTATETTGGITELDIAREIGDDFDQFLTIEARALAGEDELDLAISYEKLESWYARFVADYNRRWYDASGDYAPLRGLWVAPSIAAHELDFGEFTLDIGTQRPEKINLRLIVSHHLRSGTKNSTTLGQFGSRRIAPAEREIDETRTRVTIEAGKEKEARRWLLRASYEKAETDNHLRVTNDSRVNTPEPIDQNETTESETVAFNGYLLQRFGEKTTLAVGALAMEVDTNVGGYRDVSNGSAFTNLTGDSDLSQLQFDAALSRRWSKVVDTVFSVTARSEELTGGTARNGGFAANAVTFARDRDHVRGALEARYTGMKRTVLYGSAEYRQGNNLLSETGDFIDRVTDAEEHAREFTAGLRRHLSERVRLTLEYYYRDRDEDADHQRLDSDRARYPGWIDGYSSRVHDVNARLTIRPGAGFQAVTRADYRESRMSTALGGSDLNDASDMEQTTVSQSLSWRVKPGLHLQAQGSYTRSEFITEASRDSRVPVGLVPATVSDHWTLQVNAYAAISDKTDLQATWNAFVADNFDDNSGVALPYGVGQRDQSVDLIVTRQISEYVRGILRYGYFYGTDDATSDFNDYEAHLIYGSVRYRF